jgi:chaperone modulatory protein CbpM
MKKMETQGDVIDSLTLADLCRFCEANEAWVVELVEHGVIEPEGSSLQKWRFCGVSIARAKKARRLHRDLGINTPGIALVLDLLQERDEMLRKLARFEA